MQQTMQHQMMGYDRTSAMFSPDGRLLQVEYAKKAVKQGTTVMGVVCKDGVLLLADKRIVDALIVPSSVEKVLQVDQHIGATATGFLMDGRILIERAQLLAQQHMVTYDVPIDIQGLVKEVSNIKQSFTQFGGGRPFGVSILFGGVDEDGPRLFMTDPTGIYFEYKATAVGESETEVKAILNKEYKESMNLDAGLKLSVRALKRVLAKDFDINKIEGAFIRTDSKKFERLRKEDLKRAM